jgi:hypothetical protein
MVLELDAYVVAALGLQMKILQWKPEALAAPMKRTCALRMMVDQEYAEFLGLSGE